MPFRVEGAGIGGTIPSLPGVPFVPWFCFSPFIAPPFCGFAPRLGGANYPTILTVNSVKNFGRWDNGQGECPHRIPVVPFV